MSLNDPKALNNFHHVVMLSRGTYKLCSILTPLVINSNVSCAKTFIILIFIQRWISIKCNSNCCPSGTFSLRITLFPNSQNLTSGWREVGRAGGHECFHIITFCWLWKIVRDWSYQFIIQFSFYFKHFAWYKNIDHSELYQLLLL